MLIKLTGEQNQELQVRYKKAVDNALKYRQLAKMDSDPHSHYYAGFWDAWGQATAYYLLGQFELDPRLKEQIYG